MKKFLAMFVAAFTCILFTACKEDSVKYDLTIVSPYYNQIYTHCRDNQSDTDSIYDMELTTFCETIKDDDISSFKSITIYSDEFDDESSEYIIKKCKKENITLIFIGGKVDDELLNSYDKAFNITIDYEYIGESFSDMIHDNWKESITDRDQNKILSFTVVNASEYSREINTIYDSFIKNLELIGVPTNQHADVFGNMDEALEYCKTHKEQNEVFITFSYDLLNSLHENYTPFGENVEIIGLVFDFENHFIDDENMLIYFIDYNDFINARNEIIKNIESKNYPFDNLNYLTVGKTAYIQPNY